MNETPYQKGWNDKANGIRDPYRSTVLDQLCFGRQHGDVVAEMNEDYNEGQDDYERKHGKR